MKTNGTKKRNLLGKRSPIPERVFMDTAPGFIVSDDAGCYWYSQDMMDLLSPATHTLALELQTVGFEYGE